MTLVIQSRYQAKRSYSLFAFCIFSSLLIINSNFFSVLLLLLFSSSTYTYMCCFQEAIYIIMISLFIFSMQVQTSMTNNIIRLCDVVLEQSKLLYRGIIFFVITYKHRDFHSPIDDDVAVKSLIQKTQW